MGLQYQDLDDRTRTLMLEEIDQDSASGSLYLSDNLTPDGKAEYPDLLRTAARDGNDETLANEIRWRLNAFEKPRKLKSGGFSKPPAMRSNEHEMLAEGDQASVETVARGGAVLDETLGAVEPRRQRRDQARHAGDLHRALPVLFRQLTAKS